LIQHIASFRRDDLIRHDVIAVPEAIAGLKAQLAQETNPDIRAQLERALINRKNQLASLKLLESTIKKAELQIESALSLLGTMYSQIMIGQSTNQVADYGRLSLDVDEEIRRLQDQLEALWEVKGGYLPESSYLIAPLVDHNSTERLMH
jgi:hypothetical protein